ncbi:hypothetical protein [Clostridium brassicae]|uniref:Uncharacterized protein n=1 Tax=Clostridium brassicae TaxID=2999072 RepID=A0ABT4D7Q1_9CLOT|nr:hypothetical protein [Clostridium brassicae]MCY6957256.1 hypothetical protein [Clostridium brassicae]
MYIFIIIIKLISIKLCYDIAKKNNYNITLWTVLAIFIGCFALIILLIINRRNKRGTKWELALLIMLIIITISSFIYCKPTNIEKTYYGNMLDGKKIIKKNVSINIDGKIYKDLTGDEKIDATMNFCNKKYIINILVTKDDDHYTVFPINEENHIELSPIYISKDFNSINIIFDDSNKDYSGYTISATSSE